MSSVTAQLQKEKNKKKMIKIYIIMGVLFTIYALFVTLHWNALRIDNPRMSGSDALNLAMTEVFLAPRHISFAGGILKFFLLGCGGAAVALVLAITDSQLRKHDNPDTVNGEAHLMTPDELDEYNRKRTDPLGKTTNDGPNNMIFSRDIRLAIDGNHTRRNCNCLVIGGSGAGKSRFFISPNILQYNANFVITDPSGELLNDYGKALENNGYKVRVFNLTNVYEGNRYNPFHYIREENDIFILVETLIKNTTPPDGHGGDPFWENSEKVLLTALILYVWHRLPDDQQTFNTVVNLVNMAEVDENDPKKESKLDLLFKEFEKEDPENLAIKQYKTFKLGAGKTLKSILISVGVRLEKFKLSNIQYLTGVDEFHFEQFADTRQALFVIIPTADMTFNFLVSLMYSQLFMTLYNYVETNAQFGWQAYIDNLNIVKVEQAKNEADSKRAKVQIAKFVNRIKKHGVSIRFNKERELYMIYAKKGGDLIAWRGKKEDAKAYADRLKELKIRQCPRKCPNHVRLMLDEFANIGQIPDFDQKLATIRKYEISCAIVLQAISQLKVIYDTKWNTIAGNCDVKLFLGCDDTETIEWLTQMMGKRTTIVENISMQANGNGSTSYTHSSIDLMTVDQITMMADDECIVRVRGERPFYGKKYELTEHPNYAEAKKLSDKYHGYKIILSDELKTKIENSKGPYRKRSAVQKQKMMEEAQKQGSESLNAEKPNNTSGAVQNGQEKKSADNNTVENTANKLNAAESKKDLHDMEDQVDEEMMNSIGEALLEDMGIKPGDSDETIKERLSTKLDFDSLPDDAYVYAVTA